MSGWIKEVAWNYQRAFLIHLLAQMVLTSVPNQPTSSIFDMAGVSTIRVSGWIREVAWDDQRDLLIHLLTQMVLTSVPK